MIHDNNRNIAQIKSITLLEGNLSFNNKKVTFIRERERDRGGGGRREREKNAINLESNNQVMLEKQHNGEIHGKVRPQ